VDPASSPHFSTYSIDKKEVIPLVDQPSYKHDWIGLRELDERGGLKLEHCSGQHMDLGRKGECADLLVRQWIGWDR